MPAARQPSCRKVRVFPYQAWACCHHFAHISPNLSHVAGFTTTGISPSAAIDVDTVDTSANHLETSSRAQVRRKKTAGWWWMKLFQIFQSTLVGWDVVDSMGFIYIYIYVLYILDDEHLDAYEQTE